MQTVTNLNVSILKVHPRNEEFFDNIEGDTYEQFKSSIREDGIITPLIISPDMTVISGHQRLKACIDLDISMIPVIIREELTDENLKLRQLIASNFGRLKNDPAKMRKAITEYVDLVGKNVGDNQHSADCTTLSQKNIAKELGISSDELKRLLSIERNLIPELKQILDKGFISKTSALSICSQIPKEEQQELLTELTQLIGNKNQNINDDKKKSITNNEVESLMKQLEEERKEKEKLIELNTDLLTREYEVEQLQERISNMKKELLDRPTIETEVAPEDYQELKKKLTATNTDYSWLNNEYQQKINEIENLKKQIESLKCVSEEEQYVKKLKDGAIFFCGRVNDFIEKTGGFVWLSENINELPDYERKSYIKAIEMVENWAFAMKANMKNYL